MDLVHIFSVCLIALSMVPMCMGASSDSSPVPELVIGLGSLQVGELGPGDRYLATCSDSFVHLFSVDGGVVSSLPAVGDWPWAGIDWHPSGSIIAATDYLGHIWLLSVPNLSLIGDIDYDYGKHNTGAAGVKPWPLRYSPNGSILALGFMDNIHLYDAGNRKHIGNLEGESDLVSVAWSPDGDLLVKNEPDGMVVYNVSRYLREGEWESKHSLDHMDEQIDHRGYALFSPNGHMIASLHKKQNFTEIGNGVFTTGYSPVSLNLYDAGTGVKVSSIELEGDNDPFKNPSGLAWSPDSQFISVGTTNGKLMVIKPGNTSVASEIEAHSQAITTLSWQGSHIVTTSEDQTAKIWNVNTRGEATFHKSLTGWGAGITMVDWYPDGNHILTQYQDLDEPVSVFTSNGREKFRIRGSYGQTAVSPDGLLIATSLSNRQLLLWDAVFGSLTTILEPNFAAQICQWNPVQPRKLALAGPGGIQVWDLSKKEAHCTSRFGQHANSISWSPDGDFLALASQSSIEIWDPRRSKKLANATPTTCGTSSLTWSPDGQKLACLAGCHQYNSEIIIWNLYREEDTINLGPTRQAKIPLQHLAHTQLLSWAPNSSMIAGATTGHGVVIWNLDTPRTMTAVLNLTKPVRGITSVSWSPDSSRILTASDDGTIRIWPVGPRTPINQALETYILTMTIITTTKLATKHHHNTLKRTT